MASSYSRLKGDYISLADMVPETHMKGFHCMKFKFEKDGWRGIIKHELNTGQLLSLIIET